MSKEYLIVDKIEDFWSDEEIAAAKKVLADNLIPNNPKCECGAEKCKTTHSDWCPCK